MATTPTTNGGAAQAAPSPFLTGNIAVEVTQEWIDRGRFATDVSCRLPRECNCPVSHAVAEAGFENPRVMSATFTAGPAMASEPRRRRYRLPEAAQRFIVAFDDPHPTDHVEPFTFVVDADDYEQVEGNDLARLMRTWS